jgi:hypothetical protein
VDISTEGFKKVGFLKNPILLKKENENFSKSNDLNKSGQQTKSKITTNKIF